MTEGNGPISFSVWRKIAMASWRPRKDSWITATIDVDAGALLQYVDQVRSATGVHVTPMHVVGRAGAKVFEALPGLNGRVVLGQFVSSPSIDCFFSVSLAHRSDGGVRGGRDRSFRFGRAQRRPEITLGHRTRVGGPGRVDPCRS